MWAFKKIKKRSSYSCFAFENAHPPTPIIVAPPNILQKNSSEEDPPNWVTKSGTLLTIFQVEQAAN